MKKGPFSLSELAEVTGANRRALQFWTDRGVIFAEEDTEKAGRGTHRRYSISEASIASVVRGFAQRHISVGELVKISTSIRNNLANDKLFQISFFSGLIDKVPTFLASYVYQEDWRTICVEQDEEGKIEFLSFYNNAEIDAFDPAFDEVMQADDNMMIIIRLNSYLKGLR